MPFRGVSDETDLKAMQTALDAACAELGIGKDDPQNRERIALSVVALHEAGQQDSERLRIYAVSQFESTRSNDGNWGSRQSSATPNMPDQTSDEADVHQN